MNVKIEQEKEYILVTKQYLNALFGGPTINCIIKKDNWTIAKLIYRTKAKTWVCQFDSLLFVSENIIKEIYETLEEMNRNALIPDN